LIDEDSSNSIEFQELNKYYCKINGIHSNTGMENNRMDVESPSHYGHGQHYSPNHPVSPPPLSQQQQSNPFYQINQAFVHQQQQQGFNQFSQNKNYNPGYNSQGMNQGYGNYPNPNQSFPNQYPPNQYPPNQYPPNAYQNQQAPPGTPPYPGNNNPSFNPLDFLRK
jgi:hypothetical protein